MMARLLRTRRLLVVGVAAVAIAAVIAALTGLDRETERASVSPAGLDAGKAVSVTPGGAARGSRVEPRTRRPLGDLALRAGKLRLERAEMSDGSECLLHAELGSGVSGSQCFQRGLFGSSRVAFSINSDGGPGTFSSMYVVGIAHPWVQGPGGTETAGGPKEEKAPTGRIQVSDKQTFDDSSLTPDIVLSKIQSAYMAGLKRCYKEYLKKDASARGKVTLDLTVNETGRTVQGKASGFASEVDSCISSQMASWRFPVPKDKDGEATEASFRIALQLVPD